MGNKESQIHLLLVEDDEDFRPAIVSRLEKRRCEVTAVASAEEGLDVLKCGKFDVIVSDIRLTGMDGMKFLAKVRESQPDLPVILLTGYGNLESAQEAVKLAACDYLLKPLESIDDLLGPINKAVHSYRLKLENRRLEREIVEISESECQRIGRDLHDGVCQYLTGIGMMAGDLEESLTKKSMPEEAETAARIRELVRQTAAETRLLAAGLCPARLAEDGLTTALSALASDVKKIFNVSCFFKCGNNIFAGHEDIAIHLYRIAQEAINNAIKHGKANEIFISLDTVRDKTVLTIKDDGKGSSGEIEKATGMGSHILRHRAGMINASLDVQRAPDGGVIMTCSIENDVSAQRKMTAKATGEQHGSQEQ